MGRVRMLHAFRKGELDWLRDASGTAEAQAIALGGYALTTIYGGLFYTEPCPRTEFPSGQSVEVHVGLRRDAEVEYMSPDGFQADLAVLMVPDRDLTEVSDIQVLEVSGWCSRSEYFARAIEKDGNLVLGHPQLNTANSLFAELWGKEKQNDSSALRPPGRLHPEGTAGNPQRGVAPFQEYYPVP